MQPSCYDMAAKKKVYSDKLTSGIPLDAGKSLRQKKRERRADKASTKGKGWFDMKAPELTEEQKNDLTVLKMRSALDPKRFYKNNDVQGLPKYVEFGTVIESPAEFYSSRIPKKQRKKSIVAELLADSDLKSYNKRKLEEIQEAKMKETGVYKKVKRLKKKKK